jgi:hypothetical protein
MRERHDGQLFRHTTQCERNGCDCQWSRFQCQRNRFHVSQDRLLCNRNGFPWRQTTLSLTLNECSKRGTSYRVRGTRYQVRGTRILVSEPRRGVGGTAAWHASAVLTSTDPERSATGTRVSATERGAPAPGTAVHATKPRHN